MVDEFQDTNPLQLELLELLERDNLFAVGDEFQSIYGFRHADVSLPRAPGGGAGAGRARGVTVNFRAREELLDAVNAAFARIWGERLRAAARGARRARGRRRDRAARRAAGSTAAADALGGRRSRRRGPFGAALAGAPAVAGGRGAPARAARSTS